MFKFTDFMTRSVRTTRPPLHLFISTRIQKMTKIITKPNAAMLAMKRGLALSPTVLLTLALSAAVTPAFAKNKDNCHAIGGKWLPGSTTDSEKGACIFSIRADKLPNASAKNLVDSGTKDSSVSVDTCTKKGGKVSQNECVVQMGQGATQ